MPSYSNTSRNNLDMAHKDLRLIFECVIKGWDNSIIDSHRDYDRQMEYYNAGKSKLKYPESKHNKFPSMAVDSVPYPIDWNDRERFIGYGCYVLGVADALLKAGKITHKLRWGGDWKHGDRELTPQSFDDFPHFELIEVD